MAQILIIDDDDMVRGLYCRVLEAYGHRVSGAADGAEGIRLFREQGADVIVCDLHMPGRDGVATLLSLREADASVKLIAASGSFELSPGRLRVLDEIDLTLMLEKPFTPFQLAEAIEDAIQGTT